MATRLSCERQTEPHRSACVEAEELPKLNCIGLDYETTEAQKKC